MKFITSVFVLLLTAQLHAQSSDIYCSRAHFPALGSTVAPNDLRSDTFDIKHTTINLDFTDAQNQSISGFTRLSIEILEDAPGDLRLDFEGLTVDSLHLNGSPIGFSVGIQTLTLTPPNLNEGDTVSVKVFYHGQPITDASGWGGFYFQGDFAWNLGVGFAGDPHSYGRIWFPCFDNFVERSTYEFHITVNDGLRAACNGLLTGVTTGNGTETFHWMQSDPAPSYLACVAIGNYEVLEWSHQGNSSQYPVQLHARAQDTSQLKNSFIHLDDAISTFENSYGNYRWSKVGYSLVPFNAGAMEHVTNITYPIYAANGQLDQESLMAHELAHMWWGDLVTCESDEDMWLNEGWASFSEFLVEEQVYGRERYESAMLVDLRFMLQFGHHFEEMYRPVSPQPHEYVYGDHVYKKGALVAHNLRGYLGDDTFFDAVTTFLNQNAFSSVNSEQFRDFLTQYTGQDMTNFFNDWVFGPGYAVATLRKMETQNVNSGNEVSLFIQQKTKGTNGLHSSFPVYYTIYGPNWERHQGRANMSGEYMTILDTVDFDPVWAVLYENNELAMAVTADQDVVTAPEVLNWPNSFLEDLEITQLNSDSALLRVEHIWASPAALKAQSKPYQLSDYRYWNVTGVNLDDVVMKCSMFYDGRETGGNNGYLDIELVSNGEDSLILLYRSGADDDWVEYEFYTKNTFGNSTDGFGMIEISNLVEGEYVLGNINHQVLGEKPVKGTGDLKVYPNPAREELFIDAPGDGEYTIEIHSSSGRAVYSEKQSSPRAEVSTLGWKPGTYIVTLRNNEGLSKASVVVTR